MMCTSPEAAHQDASFGAIFIAIAFALIRKKFSSTPPPHSIFIYYYKSCTPDKSAKFIITIILLHPYNYSPYPLKGHYCAGHHVIANNFVHSCGLQAKCSFQREFYLHKFQQFLVPDQTLGHDLMMSKPSYSHTLVYIIKVFWGIYRYIEAIFSPTSM